MTSQLRVLAIFSCLMLIGNQVSIAEELSPKGEKDIDILIGSSIVGLAGVGAGTAADQLRHESQLHLDAKISAAERYFVSARSREGRQAADDMIFTLRTLKQYHVPVGAKALKAVGIAGALGGAAGLSYSILDSKGFEELIQQSTNNVKPIAEAKPSGEAGPAPASNSSLK